MRLPERRGLVMARLAGAKVVQAPVIVVLDSHVEVRDDHCLYQSAIYVFLVTGQ